MICCPFRNRPAISPAGKPASSSDRPQAMETQLSAGFRWWLNPCSSRSADWSVASSDRPAFCQDGPLPAGMMAAETAGPTSEWSRGHSRAISPSARGATSCTQTTNSFAFISCRHCRTLSPGM